MPNLATTALGFAATITVVDWILQKEARERLRPRTDAVLHDLGLDVRMFTTPVMMDYAETHLQPMPETVLAMLEQWRQDRDAEDAVREDAGQTVRGSPAPLIVIDALDLASLERTREPVTSTSSSRRSCGLWMISFAPPRRAPWSVT